FFLERKNTMTQKSLTEVVAALNSGEITMDQLLGQLETEKQYVRRGSTYSLLKYDGISFVVGAPAKVYTVESTRIDRDGKEIERKSRNGNEAES
ncbi:MAG TPA: hypothetical protein VH815_03055, partial [Acidobacteriota bacterium]